MSSFPPILLINGVSALVPFILGIYFWDRLDRPMRVFVLFTILNAMTEWGLILLALNHIQNIFLIHLYVPLAFSLLVYLFSVWYGRPNQGVQYRLIIIFWVLSAALMLMGIQPITEPVIYTNSILSITAVVLAVFILFKLLTSSSDLPIPKNPQFWVSVGLLLAHVTNTVVGPAMPHDLAVTMSNINSFMSLASNVPYSLAIYTYIAHYLNQELIAPELV